MNNPNQKYGYALPSHYDLPSFEDIPSSTRYSSSKITPYPFPAESTSKQTEYPYYSDHNKQAGMRFQSSSRYQLHEEPISNKYDHYQKYDLPTNERNELRTFNRLESFGPNAQNNENSRENYKSTSRKLIFQDFRDGDHHDNPTAKFIQTRTQPHEQAVFQSKTEYYEIPNRIEHKFQQNQKINSHVSSSFNIQQQPQSPIIQHPQLILNNRPQLVSNQPQFQQNVTNHVSRPATIPLNTQNIIRTQLPQSQLISAQNYPTLPNNIPNNVILNRPPSRLNGVLSPPQSPKITTQYVQHSSSPHKFINFVQHPTQPQPQQYIIQQPIPQQVQIRHEPLNYSCNSPNCLQKSQQLQRLKVKLNQISQKQRSQWQENSTLRQENKRLRDLVHHLQKRTQQLTSSQDEMRHNFDLQIQKYKNSTLEQVSLLLERFQLQNQRKK